MVQMKKWNNTHPIMESQNRYFLGSNYSQNNRRRGSNSIKNIRKIQNRFIRTQQPRTSK